MKKPMFLAMTALMVFAACSGGKRNASVNDTSKTHEGLVAAAQAEGTVTVYSVTSRVAQAAVDFEKQYGIQVVSENLKDGDLIERVTQEIGGNIFGADLVIMQDSARVYGQLTETDYFVNYVPNSLKNIIPPEYQNPLVFLEFNKVFIFNSEKSQEPVIKNVWELTEPAWRSRVRFQDPNREGINMSFLTMLTSPQWSYNLAVAYKNRYDQNIELTTPNAGYEWIKMFFANNPVIDDGDTTMSEIISTKEQEQTDLGLFAYSKVRFDAVEKVTLTAMTEVDPFSGFLYPIYMQLTANAAHPAAAKLFIEFLLTSDGFSVWGQDVGSYSTNPLVPSNKSDKPLSFWVRCLVSEDPRYIYDNRAKVEAFVNAVLKR